MLALGAATSVTCSADSARVDHRGNPLGRADL